MFYIFKIMIWTHIITGLIALYQAARIMLETKGTEKHMARGKKYFTYMLINATLGIFLALFNRLDYGYVVTFGLIITLMTSGICDFGPYRRPATHIFLVLSALVCVIYAPEIIKASKTELPLFSLQVYSTAAAAVFAAALWVKPRMSHALKMNMSCCVAFFAMANNSLTWCIPKAINAYVFMTVVLIAGSWFIHQVKRS